MNILNKAPASDMTICALMSTGITFEDFAKEMASRGHEYPILVRFKKPIFEDDFVEEGMIAYLTGVWDQKKQSDCYKLFFTFPEKFDEHNQLLLKRTFHPDNRGDKMKTAVEAGYWEKYYDVFADGAAAVREFIVPCDIAE